MSPSASALRLCLYPGFPSLGPHRARFPKLARSTRARTLAPAARPAATLWIHTATPPAHTALHPFLPTRRRPPPLAHRRPPFKHPPNKLTAREPDSKSTSHHPSGVRQHPPSAAAGRPAQPPTKPRPSPNPGRKPHVPADESGLVCKSASIVAAAASLARRRLSAVAPTAVVARRRRCPGIQAVSLTVVQCQRG